MANATSVGSGWGAGMNGPGVATPKPARTYTNPMNDPNSPRYWANKPQAQIQAQPGNAGSGWGLPGATTPQITQSPFQGQAGPSYQTHLPGQLGPGGMMPMGQSNQVPYPGIGQTGMGYGQVGMGGWGQDPAEIMRRRQLQQQQMQQPMGNVTTGQVQPQIQPMAQPFQQTNPWQQNIPKNFNQGNAYNPFVRAW
jgi:hypothetical protein